MIKKLKKKIIINGFTIVELLVVIVVIGILAAITIIAFNGVSQKATETAIKSDLDGAKKQLELYKVENGSYPTELDDDGCPSLPVADRNKCLKTSSGNEISYSTVDNGETFRVEEEKIGVPGTKQVVTNSTVPVANINCPTGFIVVPGSSTYNTSDFCVMKYEAKNVGGVATSVANEDPWTNIPQSDPVEEDATEVSLATCSGCHLMTEMEWLTITQNILSVPDNWSEGAVNSGYVYRGHSDNSSGILPASILDSDGYYLTGNSSTDSSITLGVVGKSQRRTLKLSNNEVIWDFTGNVMEITQGIISSNQPGLNGGLIRREYTNISPTDTFTMLLFPAATRLTGSTGWSSSQGMGYVYGDPSDNGTRVFRRGGCHWDGAMSGIFSVDLRYDPTGWFGTAGFRVAK